MATDIFARIAGIKGESLDAKHKDEIDVLSWSWGVSQAGTMAYGGGGGAGKATFADLVFTHRIDRATPHLMKACATGQHLADATITQRKAGAAKQDFLVIKLTDVTVASVANGGAVEGDPTYETVALQYGKVDLEYKKQKPDGSLEPGIHFLYDITAGKSG